MLQITNLEKSYGKQLLFDSVNLTVNPGERVGLVCGPLWTEARCDGISQPGARGRRSSSPWVLDQGTERR